MDRDIKEIDEILNEIEDAAMNRYLTEFTIKIAEIWKEIDKMNNEIKNIKNVLGIIGAKK